MSQSVQLWTRRRLLIAGGALGAIEFLKPGLVSAFTADNISPVAPGWANPKNTDINYRVDGYAKVTGAKIYASDVRGTDLDGWPNDMSYATLVLSPQAEKTYLGLSLPALGDELQPDRVITADDLDAAAFAATGFFDTDLFCKPGTVPLYLGQPVAMLFYDDLATLHRAQQVLIGNSAFFKLGDAQPPADETPYGAYRFTRVAGDSPLGPDVYSPLLDGWVGPRRFRETEAPVWTKPDATGTAPEQASFFGDQIRTEMKAGKSGKVYAQSFQTQSIDHVFMEPEAGLATYDADTRKLYLMLGVQSPQAILTAVGNLVKSAKPPKQVGEIDGHFASLGGGFGGKDHTIMPLYIALAGLYAPGRTVRLALNRYQQFQLGLKRHAFQIENQLAVDSETGQFNAYACDLTCNGGGRANFSTVVAHVGATNASSIYYVPKSDVTATASKSIAVPAGSMRGFGTLQTMTAMECLVDEIAIDLGKDPFDLRRQNVLQTGFLNLTGNAASGASRSAEVLDRMEQSALWQDRAQDKADYEAANPGKTYGIGVACVMKDYGGGGDATRAAVSLSSDGKITLHSDGVEMGTGLSTASARRVGDHLGRNADVVEMFVQGAWDALRLETSGNAWAITQADQDKGAQNPRWVPLIASPTGASVGASVNSHGPAQAAYVIMRYGLYPAALSIWGEGPLGGEAGAEFVTFDKMRWVDGKLTGVGMEPLTLEQLAARAHRDGLVTGAMVHGYNRWSWTTATFPIGGESLTLAIDALAIQQGSDEWSLIDRTEVNFPSAQFERVGVNYYATCGAVVGLGVDKVSGEVDVQAVYQVLECGRPIVPDLVSGIAQGGIAMGIGYALHEDLPLYQEGPGDGTWNLNRYHVPKSLNVPVWKTIVDVLDPLSETDPPKGMGEVVMIPVVPAILNGIHDAVGARVNSLPATPDKIRKAL
ncbi:molybdopterin cofactor-binding domain-containing protein [uncultured Ruegeria sp.]|uniref:xanthine dehydrogenase family protein molybdopterin-binding subunit n=1 Tax=uncultured Ruegeria sp. TaxID=259304 RepID=UPI00261C61F2|nr:molybdopterin cofactor-binding domain-containing protein [uncultured Ruegeria sp.]